jgi:hypothetical protein
MEPKSRRDFLKHGSAAVAAAGVVIAVPSVAAGALTGGHDGAGGKHDADGNHELPPGATLDAPVVAHVRDLKKGEVVVFAGEQEITVRNKRLAALLYHASR